MKITTKLRCALGVGCALTLTPCLAAEQEDMGAAKLRKKLERIIVGYDLNRQSKFIIDFHFSPVHAMAAYRQLLRWADSGKRPAGRAGEVRRQVGSGLRAAVLESGAGVPLHKHNEHGTAVSVLYDRALPRYTQAYDPARPETGHWSEEGMLRQVSPAGIGLAMAAEVQALESLGGEADEGLRLGLVTSMTEAYAWMAQQLVERSEGGTPSAYLPERLVQDQAGTWQVEDDNSRLFSQSALLLGLTQLHTLLEQQRGHPLGDSAGTLKARSRKSLEALFNGLRQHHFDAASGSFADIYRPGKGASGRILLEEMGILAEALAAMATQLPKGDPLAAEARRLLESQAGFLLKGLADDAPAPHGMLLKSAKAYTGTVRSLSEQVAAMNVLLATAEVTGQRTWADAALALHERMREYFWAEAPGIYRSAAGYTVSAYDGYLFGAVLAWLQRMEQVAGSDYAQMAERMIDVVLKRGGLLQAEGPESGEDGDVKQLIARGAPQLAKQLEGLKLDEQGVRTNEFLRTVMDQDGDGVPASRFAGGRYGAAPVIIIQTSVKTPYAKAEAAEKKEKAQ